MPLKRDLTYRLQPRVEDDLRGSGEAFKWGNNGIHAATNGLG